MEILTAKEIAARLKVSQYAVYQWALKGMIPRMKVGSSVRFDWEDVVCCLKSNGVGVRASALGALRAFQKPGFGSTTGD